MLGTPGGGRAEAALPQARPRGRSARCGDGVTSASESPEVIIAVGSPEPAPPQPAGQHPLTIVLRVLQAGVRDLGGHSA